MDTAMSTTKASSPASSSSALDTSEKIEAVNKASDLLSQGKRNLVCGEIPKAVSLYEEAVQLLVKSCGELSRDCAEAYFSCGSALLELGRMETSVLGAALEGVDVEEEKEEEANEQFEKPTESEGKERHKLREEVYEAMAEGEREEQCQKTVSEKCQKSSTEEKTEACDRTKEDIESKTNEDKCEAPDEIEEDAEEDEENTADDKDIQDGEEIDGEDKEEDVPNFQLAWEYLDLAKVIYLKSESAEDQLKAAECYIKLGEVSMETEQHVTAAEDIESALKIQHKLLSAEDRLIAETHYQLGLAYGLGKDFKLSIQHYTEAIGVIEAKIASLNRLVREAAVVEDNKDNAESEQVKKYLDEIIELQELIPEMRNKIEDAQEEAKDMEKMKQIAKEALGFSVVSKKCESASKRAESSAGDRITDVDENGEKKATDIAHLIRKKRKPDDEVQAANDPEAKKSRQDDSSAAVNGSTQERAQQTSEPVSSEQIPS